MPSTEKYRMNFKTISVEFPVKPGESPLTGDEIRYYLVHLTKAFTKITDIDEFNKYLDDHKKIDKIYDRIVEAMPTLEARMKKKGEL